MKITTLALILATALPQPVYAADFLIRETESAIIVEYNGEPDVKPADSNATQIATDKVAKSTEAKPVQVAPIPTQPAPLASTTDDDEKPSEHSMKRAEASAARAKARAAKIARSSN